MAENEVIDIAKKYADQVRKIMKTKEIILYGSHAKGTAAKDSDIDIAVIVDSIDADYLTAVSRLWSLTRYVNDKIEPILMIDGEDQSGFLHTVRNTGIAV